MARIFDLDGGAAAPMRTAAGGPVLRRRGHAGRIAAAGTALLVLLGCWLWPTEDGDPSRAVAVGAGPVALPSFSLFAHGGAAASSDHRSEAGLPARPSTPRDGRSPTPVTSLAAVPAGAAAWAHERRHFDRLRWTGGDAALVRDLALRLDAGLPQQLAAGGVGLGSALELKAVLLEVLEPDAESRQASLLRWWSAQARSPAPAGADAAGLRGVAPPGEIASLLAAWQAQPADLRDGAELLERLQGVP